MREWLAGPLGQYVLGWEQSQMDRVVSDLFGFHALQLGLEDLQGLKTNRMPHRWLGMDHARALGVDFVTDFRALPFAEQSLDWCYCRTPWRCTCTRMKRSEKLSASWCPRVEW